MNALLNTIALLSAEENNGALIKVANLAYWQVVDGNLSYAEKLLSVIYNTSNIDWAPALYEFIIATA